MSNINYYSLTHFMHSRKRNSEEEEEKKTIE